MERTLLEVSGLTYSTPAGRLLAENLDLQVRSGELLLITGPNGCGKSTLLKILLETLSPQAGNLERHIPTDRMVFLPQLQNTEFHLPMTLRDVLDISVSERVSTETICSFGLLTEAHLSLAWNTASGGERKRTLLTRSLLQDPWLLALDEPMNHLDLISRRAVMRALASFLETKGMGPRAVVLVSHEGFEDEEQKLFVLKRLELGTRSEWN